MHPVQTNIVSKMMSKLHC